jgi:hypothetical protein
MATPKEVEKRWRACAWFVYSILSLVYMVYCGLLIQRAYALSKHPLVASFTDSKRTVKLPYIALCLDEKEYFSDCGPGQYQIGRIVSRCLVRGALAQPEAELLPKFGNLSTPLAEIDEQLPEKWYSSAIFNRSATLENLGKSNPGIDFTFGRLSVDAGDVLSNCKAELIQSVRGFVEQNSSLFCMGYDLEGFETEQPSGPRQGATIDLYLGLSDYMLPDPYFLGDWTYSTRGGTPPSKYCKYRQNSAGYCGPSCNSIQVYLAENRGVIEERLTDRGVGIYRAFANQTSLVGMDVTYREPFTSSTQTAFFKPVDVVVLTPEQQNVGLCSAESVECSGAGLDVYYVVTDQDYYILRFTLSANNIGVTIQQEQNPWLVLVSTLGGAWFLIPLTFGLLFVSIEQRSSERLSLVTWQWVKEQVSGGYQALVSAIRLRRIKEVRVEDMDVQLRSMESIRSSGQWEEFGRREHIAL